MLFPAAQSTTTIDPVEQLPQLAGLAVKAIVQDAEAGPLDIAFAGVTVRPGQSIPTSSMSHAAAIYLTSGTVRAWRAGTSVEVAGPAAISVPAEAPFALEVLGGSPAELLVSWARGGEDRTITGTLLEDAALESDTNPGEMPFGPIIKRWVAKPDGFPWEPVESTKGLRLSCKYLLDPASGTDDFVVGLADIRPRTHYTIHRHEPAEIYFVLAGTARIWVGDTAFDVAPGDTVYVPPFTAHGIDTAGERLEMYWFYAIDQHDSWTWEPLEPIYIDPPRRPLESGPRRGVHRHS